MTASPGATRSRNEAGGPQQSQNGTHHTQHSKQQHVYPQLSRKFVARRISEGETGRLKEELKCQACGKGYKHVSSLAKHLWEHTPEWNVTSKLLISKHQQVQLLEAASILVSMNDEDNDDEDEEADANGNISIGSASVSSSEAANSASTSATSTTTNSSRAGSHDTPTGTVAAATAPTDERQETQPQPRLGPLKPEHSDDSAIDMEDLAPARDIPILSAKPIAKIPSRHGHRRMSTNAGSLGSLGSLGRSDAAFLRQASPLPESILAKDHSHHPPLRRRRRSTFHASSVPRESSYEYEEDGLQDPHESPDNDAPQTPKQSPRNSPRKSTAADVFGLEV